VEADESSDLVCCSFDRVVERIARESRSHVERKRAAIRIQRSREVPPCRVPVLKNMSPMLDEERILKAHVVSDHAAFWFVISFGLRDNIHHSLVFSSGQSEVLAHQAAHDPSNERARSRLAFRE